MVDWTTSGRANSFWTNQSEPARHVVAEPNGNPAHETRSWLRRGDREDQDPGHRGSGALM